MSDDDDSRKDAGESSKIKELFDEDSDDSSSDESVGAAVKKSEEPSTPNNPESDEKGTQEDSPEKAKRIRVDYDENDSDVEFDDTAAEIQGTSRPDPPPEVPRVDEDGNEMMENGDGFDRGETGIPHRSKLVKEPPLPPKSLSVLDIPRPFVSKNPKQPITLHITRLPNALGINPVPHDPDTYDPLDEEEKYGIIMSNMIRWRYAKENGKLKRDFKGQLIRESNARVVKWSDGSMSLYIGKEMFDLAESKYKVGDSKEDEKAASDKDANQEKNTKARHFLYLSQRALQLPNKYHPDLPSDKSEPLTVLECMGPIASKMSAKPSSLQSNAHKALTLKVRQETVKRARIAETVTRADPEAEKAKRIAMKDTLLKTQRGKSSYGRTSRAGGRRTRTNRNTDYEDDEKYDSFNINAMKKKVFTEDGNDAMEDNEDDDGGWEKKGNWRSQRDVARKAAKQRERYESSDDEENEALFEDDDSEGESAAPVRMKKKFKSGALLDDDDEDD